jgi:hypothetical protein
MKYLNYYLLLFILSGCTSLSQTKEDYESSVKFNVKAGKYQQYILQTWKMTGTDCIEFEIIQPYFGTKWMPTASIIFNNDDYSKSAKIFLYSEINDKKSIALIFSDGEKQKNTNTVIKEGIKYGQAIRLKISYPNENTINIYFDGQEYIEELDFNPTKISFVASSSESEIKILRPRSCTQ